MARARSSSVTLHSSWRGIISAHLGALLVLALGLFALAAAGPNVLPLVIFGFGVVLLLIALFDYPVSCCFDAEGAQRRMVLRRHTLQWDRVRQLTRTRPGIVRGIRGLRVGGLTAVVGRRRYLLVDQPESGEEYDLIEEVLGERGGEIGLQDLMRPDTGIAPTWLYRRSKWAPGGTKRR